MTELLNGGFDLGLIERGLENIGDPCTHATSQ